MGSSSDGEEKGSHMYFLFYKMEVCPENLRPRSHFIWHGWRWTYSEREGNVETPCLNQRKNFNVFSGLNTQRKEGECIKQQHHCFSDSPFFSKLSAFIHKKSDLEELQVWIQREPSHGFHPFSALVSVRESWKRKEEKVAGVCGSHLLNMLFSSSSTLSISVLKELQLLLSITIFSYVWDQRFKWRRKQEQRLVWPA